MFVGRHFVITRRTSQKEPFVMIFTNVQMHRWALGWISSRLSSCLQKRTWMTGSLFMVCFCCWFKLDQHVYVSHWVFQLLKIVMDPYCNIHIWYVTGLLFQRHELLHRRLHNTPQKTREAWIRSVHIWYSHELNHKQSWFLSDWQSFLCIVSNFVDIKNFCDAIHNMFNKMFAFDDGFNFCTADWWDGVQDKWWANFLEETWS